jgi:uncharacterized protein (DUF2267 family)
MMQVSVPAVLDASIQKTHQWLLEFMDHTGRRDEEKAWQMMRGVLRVLRDRLTIEQCAHLSAQLPLILRGVYFEGWKPSRQPLKIRNLDDFVQAVAQEFANHPEIPPQQAIEGTFHVLNSHISRGEIDKIKSLLQPELRNLWPES